MGGGEPAVFALGLAGAGERPLRASGVGDASQVMREPGYGQAEQVLKAVGITQLDPPQSPAGEETLT